MANAARIPAPRRPRPITGTAPGAHSALALVATDQGGAAAAEAPQGEGAALGPGVPLVGGVESAAQLPMHGGAPSVEDFQQQYHAAVSAAVESQEQEKQQVAAAQYYGMDSGAAPSAGIGASASCAASCQLVPVKSLSTCCLALLLLPSVPSAHYCNSPFPHFPAEAQVLRTLQSEIKPPLWAL